MAGANALNMQYVAMSLEEEEEGGVTIERRVITHVQDEYKWCLVGIFLNERTIDFPSMKSMMASLWRPVRGVWIKELNPYLFLF